MTRAPETDYAWNGDVALAYQVFGEGPVDLVYLQGYTSHVDLNWESPHLARFLRGLGSRARVIHTDRRGWGCSDRFSPGDVAPLEVQVDDLVAVMEAAGSEHAVIFGSWECSMTATLFAATYPQRTAGLVLCDPFVNFYATEDTPWMWSETRWAEFNDEVRRAWGRKGYLGVEEGPRDARESDWLLRWMRASVAPGALAAESDAFGSADIRGVLPSIHVPTLVVGSPDEGASDQNARFLKQQIAGSHLIEPDWQGEPWWHWYKRAPSILKGVGELIAGIREEEAELDRVLATVLFTDIVDSTATAAVMGDAKWRKLLDEHDRLAKAIVARYRGEYVESTGDGMLATFDGPARAVRCAQALGEALTPLGVEIRAGAHTGEITRSESGVAGLGVHVAARVAAVAGANEVWTSSTVKDLTAGSGLAFEDAGEHELKGVPDRWRLYRVMPS